MATIIKLQIPGGQANPAPPVGPALGQHGLNIQEFCARFNNETNDRMGKILPVEIYVNEDRTYTYKIKTPPAAELLKEAAKIQKGSGKPHLEKVGTVTRAQIEAIAKEKMIDLNTTDPEAAARIIEGTARQMGITVEG